MWYTFINILMIIYKYNKFNTEISFWLVIFLNVFEKYLTLNKAAFIWLKNTVKTNIVKYYCNFK